MGKRRPLTDIEADRQGDSEGKTVGEIASKSLKGTNVRTTGPKGLQTKIPIERPSGRPSFVETIMLNELIRNAAIMKGWLIVNNRVATGEAVNSIRIKVTRGRTAKGLLSSRINTSQTSVDGQDVGKTLNKAAKIARSTDIGLVQGVILGVPHLKFALQGRGAGTPPRTADILAWMQAKGVGFSDTRMSLSQQAFHIAQSIGASGTQPPHFTTSMRTKIVKVSAAKLVRGLRRVFPKFIGAEYAKAFVALGELYDNIEIRRISTEEQQFERFI